jgi:hypothetical protein
VWLLRHYSETYACQQYRSLQQFFRWLAAEDEIADPMARLRAPKVADKPVPCFTSVELSKLEKACQGSTFAQRRDAAILAVFRATGIRLAELAGIRYHPDDPGRSDVDLQRREIYIRASAERTGSCGSIMRLPAGSTGISGSGPGTRRWSGGAAVRRACRCTRTGSGTTSATPGARRGGGRLDGAERLGLPSDAAEVRRQCARRAGTPPLRSRHGRLIHRMPLPVDAGRAPAGSVLSCLLRAWRAQALFRMP